MFVPTKCRADSSLTRIKQRDLLSDGSMLWTHLDGPLWTDVTNSDGPLWIDVTNLLMAVTCVTTNADAVGT